MVGFLKSTVASERATGKPQGTNRARWDEGRPAVRVLLCA